MSTDTICLELVRRGIVVVDTARGLAYSKRWPSRPLGSRNRGGYIVCTLHLGGARKQVKLHRLIWIAANGLPPAGMVIDHVNRVKDDNRIANLRLADAALNSRNRRSYAGAGNPACKLSPEAASAIRSARASGCGYASIAKRFGISTSLVGYVVRGEAWNCAA